MSKPTFTISKASLQDAERFAEIGTRSFDTDTHSQMKIMAQRPGDFYEGNVMGARQYLESPRVIVFKATDDSDGTIVGHASWSFRGIEIDAAAAEGEVVKPIEGKTQIQHRGEADEEIPGGARVKELDAMTGKHLQDNLDSKLTEGCKAIVTCGLSVDPRYQGRGIGSQLMKWATDQADEHGAFMWVHSSESGWPFYAKHGFEETDTLTIDLDEWAVGPPPKDGLFGDREKWGTYTFRYGIRQPVTK